MVKVPKKITGVRKVRRKPQAKEVECILFNLLIKCSGQDQGQLQCLTGKCAIFN